MISYIIQYVNTLSLPAGGQQFDNSGEIIVPAEKLSAAVAKAELLLGKDCKIWCATEAAEDSEFKEEDNFEE
jgi:hypothetical protein